MRPGSGARMRITIFGTGALGCLFGARLARVAQVTLVGTWAEALAAVDARGILLEEGAESRTVRVGTARLGARVPAADLVLVLVKSWQTAGIVPHLGPALGEGGAALTLQNGLGNLERLGPGVAGGVTTEGATLLGPGHVRAGGAGPPSWRRRNGRPDSSGGRGSMSAGAPPGRCARTCGGSSRSAAASTP